MPTSTKPREVGTPAVLTKAGSAPRILAADDQQHILEAIELLLKPQGYKVDVVRSPELAREALSSAQYDAVLIDLNYTRDTTSGREGLDLLSEIVALDSTLPIIVMTAWGNVELAVESMRRGARDFIQKPWETSACSLFSARKWNSIARCSERSDWRPRTGCSMLRACLNSSRLHLR